MIFASQFSQICKLVVVHVHEWQFIFVGESADERGERDDPRGGERASGKRGECADPGGRLILNTVLRMQKFKLRISCSKHCGACEVLRRRTCVRSARRFCVLVSVMFICDCFTEAIWSQHGITFLRCGFFFFFQPCLDWIKAGKPLARGMSVVADILRKRRWAASSLPGPAAPTASPRTD